MDLQPSWPWVAFTTSFEGTNKRFLSTMNEFMSSQVTLSDESLVAPCIATAKWTFSCLMLHTYMSPEVGLQVACFWKVLKTIVKRAKQTSALFLGSFNSVPVWRHWLTLVKVTWTLCTISVSFLQCDEVEWVRFELMYRLNLSLAWTSILLETEQDSAVWRRGQNFVQLRVMSSPSWRLSCCHPDLLF